MFLSYTLFELLDAEHGTPLSHRNVNWNSPDLEQAIDPLSPGGILYTTISWYYIILATKWNM